MRKWTQLLLIVAGIAFSIAVFSHLPERVAVHWNARGEVDGFGSRTFAAFGPPLMTTLIWLLLRAVPRIDPRRSNIEKFRDSYEWIVTGIVLLLLLIHVAVLGAALGWPISMARVAPLAVGVLFIGLGNLLPRVRSNFFIGIRTPWTLSSDRVWTRTHRVGGYAMVLAGLVVCSMAFFRSTAFAFVTFAAVLASALFSVVYSYVAWRQEQRGG